MSDTQKRQGTIAALSGARAIPPLLIVYYHYCEGHHYSGVRLLDLVATRGYLWVEFFFALSGFVLTLAYGARLKALWTGAGYAGFLKARLARLYPLHLFMLLALGLLMLGVRAAAHWGGYVSIYDRAYHPMMTGEGLIASLLLVHGWNTLPYLTWNGASWFVSVEFALCLLFPALLWLAGARAWRGLLLAGAGVGLMLALLATSAHGLDITFHNGVLRGLASFAVGMGLAGAFAAGRDRAAALPGWLFSAVQIALLAVLAYVVTHAGWSHNFRDLYTVLPLLLLIPALAFDRGVLAALLKREPFQRIGEWSYAIYLGQTFWLHSMRVIEFRFYPDWNAIVLGTRFSTLMWWLEPLALVLVCLAWGALLAEGVEKPAARWLRARLDRPRATAST